MTASYSPSRAAAHSAALAQHRRRPAVIFFRLARALAALAKVVVVNLFAIVGGCG
jgi:hypothetical protein